ncbi:MAG: lamin tail domain-containing protein [Kineosporiaceae bacterium]
MRRPALTATVAATAMALCVSWFVAVAPGAHAATLRYWTGTLTSVADGDTVYVDIAGDGTATSVPIRMIGIQATETHDSPVGGGAECLAVAAKTSLARFLPVGTRVRLSAYNASSTKGTDGAGRTRLFRYVDRWHAATKTWQDAQLPLLEKGLAVWLRSPVETAHVARYHAATQRAVSKRVGLFTGSACGAGPSAGADLLLWLHYDVEDETAANQEYLRIRNRGTTAVPLAGWRLRDGSHTFWRGTTYWRFPTGAAVAAGKTITVYFGPGTSSPSAGRYYLGIAPTHYLPNDASTTANAAGKTLYLLDPHLDVRGVADYGCTVACRRPSVEVSTVSYASADERIDLRLPAGAATTQDLTGVVVTNDGRTKEITPGTVLAPGETLTIHLQRTGPGSRLVQYWPHAGPILENGGDTVVLRTAWGTTLDTYSWGSG